MASLRKGMGSPFGPSHENASVGKTSWRGCPRKPRADKTQKASPQAATSSMRVSTAMAAQPAKATSAPTMEEMEAAFKFFDENKDGQITAAELAMAMKRLGDSASEEEVREMVKAADSNGDGVISFEEFVGLQEGMRMGDGAGGGGRWCGSLRQKEGRRLRQEVRMAFLRFDADGNGLISAEELQKVMARLGRPSRLGDCRRMISRVDQDGDGHVNFEEFFSMMMNGQHG